MVACLIISCNQPKQRVQNSSINVDSISKTANSKTIQIALSKLESTVDPECGMTLTEKSIEDTSSIDGKLFGFCGSSCKEVYLKKLASKK